MSTNARIDSLGHLPIGGSGVVRRVNGTRLLARRLMEMGLLPGTRVTLTRVAPLGDPLELRLRGYALSIRRSEALQIEIEPGAATRSAMR